MGLRSFFKPLFDRETKNKIENNFCNPFHMDQSFGKIQIQCVILTSVRLLGEMVIKDQPF